MVRDQFRHSGPAPQPGEFTRPLLAEPEQLWQRVLRLRPKARPGKERRGADAPFQPLRLGRRSLIEPGHDLADGPALCVERDAGLGHAGDTDSGGRAAPPLSCAGRRGRHGHAFRDGRLHGTEQFLGSVSGPAAANGVGHRGPASDVDHATPRHHEHGLDVSRPDVYADQRRHASIMAHGAMTSARLSSPSSTPHRWKPGRRGLP